MSAHEAKYVIIGGGIAGTTAAQELRAGDPHATIIIISDEPHRLYSRIMLSKKNFFLGMVPFDAIWLKKEEWYAENSITLVAGSKATRVDSARKKVCTDNGDEFSYQKLLIATGGSPRMVGVAGGGLSGVHCVRTLEDAKAIIAEVKSARKALVIGSGFVGFEMSDLLRQVGAEVSVVMRGASYWHSLLDPLSSGILEKAFLSGGVVFERNTEVVKLLGGAPDASGHVKVARAVFANGKEIECDMVIVGVGIEYNHAWLDGSGITTSKGIICDEFLRTNVPDIWAAGDVAEFNDVIIGRTVQLGNWANAQMQGRVAAKNMRGEPTEFRLVSFYTTQGFGLSVAFAGDVASRSENNSCVRETETPHGVARFISRDNRLVGATLINRTQDLSWVVKRIESRAPFDTIKERLADPSIELTTIV